VQKTKNVLCLKLPHLLFPVGVEMITMIRQQQLSRHVCDVSHHFKWLTQSVQLSSQVPSKNEEVTRNKSRGQAT